MVRFDREIQVKSFGDLRLVYNVIGYPDEGESIVFSLFNKQNPIFTIVTDCFKANDYNHTVEVLKEYGVNTIDAFVWTHPDYDHSVGIEEILELYDHDHQAMIFLPETFNGEKKDYRICVESQNAIRYLMENYNSGRKYRINFIGLNPGESPRVFSQIKISELSTGHDVFFSMAFLAPNSDLAERRDGEGRDFLLNDLSLVYVIRLNGCDYLFTGDLSEQTIQFLDQDYLNNVRFIKIPHHGSKSAKGLIGLLKENEIHEAISVCTTFSKKNLPEKDVLIGYKSLGEKVYCTGTGGEDYGCVKTMFKMRGVAETEPELFGNAYLFLDE